MPPWFEVLLSSLGGSVVALGGAAWLFRQWINHRLERELETYKTQLTQKSEVLKTELSIYAHEQNVGLSRIDGQRSEAILSIWEILTRWHETFLTITAPNSELKQDSEKAVRHYKGWSNTLMESSNRLSTEIRNRAIFFHQAAYETITRCGNSIHEVTNRYYETSFDGVDIGLIMGMGIDKSALADRIDAARERLRNSAQESVNELREALIAEFRLLMGAEKLPVSNTLESGAARPRTD